MAPPPVGRGRGQVQSQVQGRGRGRGKPPATVTNPHIHHHAHAKGRGKGLPKGLHGKSQVTRPSESRKSTATDGGGDDDEEEEEVEAGQDVITGVNKQRRIVLSKRTYLLGALVLITGLCITAVVFANEAIAMHGYPPLNYASEASSNTLTSLITLIIISPIGFFILKFRITNLLIGFGYMFLLVLCVIYPTKAVVNGVLSLSYDTNATIQHYIASEADIHKLHKFWSHFQQYGQCCGTRELDRVNDWPYFLNTSDIPDSCCLKSYRTKFEKTNVNATGYDCGRGLARTRDKGVPFQHKFPRVFSGFFLSLTQAEKERLKEKFHISVDPGDKVVEFLDVIDMNIKINISKIAFLRSWKNFFMDERCNREFVLRKLTERLPEETTTTTTPRPGTTDTGKECENPEKIFYNDLLTDAPRDMVERPNGARWTIQNDARTVGFIRSVDEARRTCEDGAGYLKKLQFNLNRRRNDYITFNTTEFCHEHIPNWRSNATTLGRKLLLYLDYITTYLHEITLAETNVTISGYHQLKAGWALWEIPTYYEFAVKLAANLHRVSTIKDPEDILRKAKRMYYLSKGISENYILADIISPGQCGREKEPMKFKSKVARDMNRRWIMAGPVARNTNPEEGLGLYFLEMVHAIVYLSTLVSACSIAFVIVIAIVFWQYYSRIKAEEYANLALPKEFEVLHLRRGSLIDAAIAAEIPEEPIKKRVVRHHKKTTKPRHEPTAVAPGVFPGLNPMSGMPPFPFPGPSFAPSSASSAV